MVDVRKLAVCAMLTAMGVVLGGALSIPGLTQGAYTFKISLGMLPVILSGVLYGPIYGGMVGGLVDLLQALIFPKGPYMPWFTITGVLFGLIPGLFFARGQKRDIFRLFAAVFTGQFVSSVLLNTAILVFMSLNSKAWTIIICERIITQSVMVPVFAAIIYGVLKLMDKTKLKLTDAE